MKGLQRIDFKEQLGQMKVRTLARLPEQVNNWAGGEDSVRNELEIKIARSERDYDYHTGDRGFDRRRKRLGGTSTTTEDPTCSRPVSQMIDTVDIMMTSECSAGITKKKPPQAQKQDWRSRQPRDDARAYRSAKEQIDGPCILHGFRNERGELRSGHALRNCRRF